MSFVQEESMQREMFRRRGSIAACAVLMVANQFAPFALAGDEICRSNGDVNCDQIVDGVDLGFLLSNWGTDTKALDLDGDCTVGGGDLAMMLGGWGVLPEIPDLHPVLIGKEIVRFCLGDAVILGVVSSDLVVQDDSAVLEGWASVTINNEVQVSMEFADGAVTIHAGGSRIEIDGNIPGSDILVDGEWHPTCNVLDGLYADIEANVYDAADWRGATQAVVGLTLLHMTDSYSENLVSQRAASASHGFWCKAAAVAAGAAITALATAGCLVLTGSCAVGTVVTFGSIAIPCTALIALCAGGVFAGACAAYELALHYWGD